MRNQNCLRLAALLAAVVSCVNATAVAQSSTSGESIAAVTAGRSEVRWQPHGDYASLVLTVSAPGGAVYRSEFEAGMAPSFSLIDKSGEALPDGPYTFELLVVPQLAPGVKEALAASREKGNGDEIERDFQKRGLLPLRPLVQSGSFLIEKGSVVLAGQTEREEPQLVEGETPGVDAPDRPKKKKKKGEEGTNRPLDQVIPDDLIVQMSLCVGFDCVNGESFGFDTIRLKENNTRIKFEDTSVGTFATTDWQLTANDSASGGASKFSIEDVTGATVPFTIAASAPTNSMFVSSVGRLGLRTSTPVLDVHAVTGNTPAIRLDQSGSGGFTPQVWDIAGNEANFFIRDVTGGSRLPLRIQPGAPTNSLMIHSSGNVGVGTLSPTDKLHVFADTNAFNFARVQNPFNGVGAAAFVVVQANTAVADLRAHADARTITRFGVTLGGWSELLQTSGSGFAIGTFGSAPLILGTNSADRIHITPTGNVGIGTPTPAGKLDVNGTIFQRGVQIHADYVFEPGFNLESIEDHSEFMWNNKHLPALGARKVDEQGKEVVEIGAQMRGMLEELEKAHIYIATLNGIVTEKETQIASLSEAVQQQQRALNDLVKKVTQLEKQKTRVGRVRKRR